MIYMKSITNKLKTLYQALNQVTGLKAYHYMKPDAVIKSYLVWAEDGENNSFHSDNSKEEQTITGYCDYYTQTEFDSMIDSIQECLNGVTGCSWRLEAVQYEETTKLIHYTWNWELV